jgi:hypothetical protein
MKKIILFFLLVVTASVVINSCKKENEDDSSGSASGGSMVNATIAGQVINEGGLPLSNVNISVNGNISQTDSLGIFFLKGNVTKSRCVMVFDKTGYVKRQHALIPTSGVTNYVKIMLVETPVISVIPSGFGGTVPGVFGGTIDFPANAFVMEGTSTAYNGQVKVTARLYNPDQPNFGLTIPGGDLKGKNSNGENVNLYSFGMMDVTIAGSSGEALQLVTGLTATITFPIASSQSATAPATIPLWYLDETDATWKEDGQATKIGNNYVGEVSHFTTWNVDWQGPSSTITGRVVDCTNTPVSNVEVTVDGLGTVTTDANGNYTASIPAGWTLVVHVLPQGIIQQPSQNENVNATPNQNYSVPDLIVPCGSYVTLSITGCQNQPIEGYAYLHYNNELIYWQHTSSGNFNMMGLANESHELVLTSTSGTVVVPAVFGNQGLTIPLGTIQLCNSVSSENGFVINGGGYMNQTVTFNGGNTIGDYWLGSATTLCQIDGITELGHVYIEMKFHGQQTGVINYSTFVDSTKYFWLDIFGNNDMQEYLPDADHQLNVNITQYGAVGDSIKGTFSGQLYDFPNTVTITDGRFAVRRGEDQQ